MIHADTRREALSDWLGAQLRAARFSLEPASEDASFRRYWRARLEDGRSFVVMDAPPDKEDCRPFVRVAGLLRAAGVHAPEIFAQDHGLGFLLLADLGTTPYLEALTADNAARLFADATEALLRWQLATRQELISLLIRKDRLKTSLPCSPRTRWRSPGSTCTATTCRET